MKASRLTAIGLVAAAGLWIASGHFLPHETAESRAAIRGGESEVRKLFRVAVVETSVIPHSRMLTISGRTAADKRVNVTARTGGILTELRVKRGMWVKQGEIMAILSDEAREAQVAQAEAVVTQRRTELEAKRQLILNGTLPRLQLVDLEAQLKAAEATLAGAEAERDRGVVRAPWSGVVHDVAVEVGQAAFSMGGREIAQIVALDPMLAVVEVAERRLAGIKAGEAAEVRLVTGEIARGTIRFVAKTASQTTRTYRVEIELPNADGKIPDGITAEVSVPLSPVPATRVPRSALTFSSAGELGVRVVGADETVGFVPVSVVEDAPSFMWLGGIAVGSRVIVQGQDFVREGQKVEAVMAASEVTATAR
jgi:membrane fusion protein, multidrug efflux system